MARSILFAALLLFSGLAAAAGPEWIAIFGRGSESADTDVGRLGYRVPLQTGSWWTPTHAQFGASIWRVPDIRGTTRRFDLNATAIWRAERGWGYYEAGIGGYLLSKSINNDDTRVPTAFEFGSHLGVGLRIAGDHTIGLGYQHLSNAGIKQPNGGINLLLVQYSYAVR